MMAKQIAVSLTDEEYDRIRKLVAAGHYRSMAEFARTAIREFLRDLGMVKLLSFRDVSREQAMGEVKEYLTTHSGVIWPDEMAEELGIDYRLVLDVVKELIERGEVEVVEE